MILAGLLLGRIGGRFRPSVVFVVGLAGVGACVASVALAVGPVFVMVSLFLQGWFFLPVQATMVTIIQQATDDEVRGRVVGAVSSAMQSAMIGSMAAGLLGDLVGIRVVFLVAGSIIAIGAVAAWRVFRPSAADQRVPEATVSFPS